MQDCRLDFTVDPGVLDMDAAAFRGFVNDTCVPIFYETIAKAKSKVDLVEDVLTDQVRDGEGRLSCSADSHGDVRCEGSISIRF